MEAQHSKRRPNVKTIVATLRRRVAHGDLSAMCELEMWLQEGFQDRKGRSVLRSNPAYAFQRVSSPLLVSRSRLRRRRLKGVTFSRLPVQKWSRLDQTPLGLGLGGMATPC